MFCGSCGKGLKDGSSFCPKCGTPIQNGVVTKKLKCQDCGGTMDYDPNDQILFCSFCGSKDIILESDTVKVAKIQKDVELGKKTIDKDIVLGSKTLDIEKTKTVQDHELEQMRLKQELEEKEDKRMIPILIGVVLFILLMFGIMIFMAMNNM